MLTDKQLDEMRPRVCQGKPADRCLVASVLMKSHEEANTELAALRAENARLAQRNEELEARAGMVTVFRTPNGWIVWKHSSGKWAIEDSRGVRYGACDDGSITTIDHNTHPGQFPTADAAFTALADYQRGHTREAQGGE